MLLKNEIVVDNFAGGGGASTGMELGLNRHIDIAINHDPAAIDMHKMNHPETKHYCESVWDVDPVEACAGRPVGLAWFSPDCKHFSKAKGNRPVDKNIRGLAWVAIRWAALVPVRIIMLENVEEFMTWGPVVEAEEGKFKPCPDRKGETFEAFVKVLTTGLEKQHPAWEEIRYALGENFPYEKLEKGLGYNVDYRVLHACDYGAPTIRKRFFLVARNDKQPIEWPVPTHGQKGSGLMPYATAADIIDWSIPVKSIFGRKKPLAEKTMERIAKGLEKFVFGTDSPFVVNCECAFIAKHYTGVTGSDLREPLATVTTTDHNALVMAFMTKFRSGSVGYDIETPVHTITSGGEQKRPGTANTQALVTSHMVKLRGTNIGHATNEPLHTISAGGLHLGEVRAFLIKYYGTSFAEGCDTPIGTVTTKDRFGLVTVHGEQYQIVDIGMRMLEPHELFAAQGFPSEYKITHNSQGKKISKASQVARCGNAVCPPVAQALVEANLQPLSKQKAA
ncbi:DNA cytosine methyltransferase [Vibrio sp. V02_P2A34T13]|nr:DNA cytosine methyltransferase [Vibrio sp. V22_P2S10T140]OXX44108.1 DNA cytosine methyltransferase [Vibrio sp. V07_P2A8T137]OXX58247.1 DNA cytosine methyltransferase [Vibrio sp. V10_P2A27P122]PSD42414.1 DNA cytosine methyltransferase [Vibrio sp. V02_P2A34T13]